MIFFKKNKKPQEEGQGRGLFFSKKQKNSKASFVTRLSAFFIDLALALFLASNITLFLRQRLTDWPYLPWVINALFLLFYYLFFESYLLRRTPGKWFFRLRMLGVHREPATRTWMIVRTLARLILGPLGLLMWRRTSLVDLFSGLRVYSVDALQEKDRLRQVKLQGEGKRNSVSLRNPSTKPTGWR